MRLNEALILSEKKGRLPAGLPMYSRKWFESQGLAVCRMRPESGRSYFLLAEKGKPFLQCSNNRFVRELLTIDPQYIPQVLNATDTTAVDRAILKWIILNNC